MLEEKDKKSVFKSVFVIALAVKLEEKGKKSVFKSVFVVPKTHDIN